MARQLALPIRQRFSHGGARKGAGRPKCSKLQPHIGRREFQARHPLHVTVRLNDGLPSLRKEEAFRGLKAAIAQARLRGLAIAHFAVLSNHLHLVLESSDRRALSRAMQSLGISLSKRLNAIARRRGPVFRERYHVHILKTPREVKHALAYVLANAYNHGRRRGRIMLDAYSSAVTVADSVWQKLIGRDWSRVVGFPEGADPQDHQSLLVSVSALLSAPRTWLLREGWVRG